MTDGTDASSPAARPDESVVPPLTDPPSREEALPYVRPESQRPVTGPHERDGHDELDLGNKTLTTLVRLRLFIAFFCWLADKQYPASYRADRRVSTLRKNSPHLYWVCVTFDIAVLVLAVLFAFALVAITIFNTTLRR